MSALPTSQPPPPSTTAALPGEWPAWFSFLVLWVLGAGGRLPQTHGVGGFRVQFTIIPTDPHNRIILPAAACAAVTFLSPMSSPVASDPRHAIEDTREQLGTRR